MKIDKRNPHHWLLLLQQGCFTLLAIIGRYLWRKPRKPVVILYGHQLSGNLRALYEAWRIGYREKFDCYFLSLDPDYSQILRQQNVPVLQCNKLPDMLLAGRSAAMITDHGLHAMSPFIAFTTIRFIDVWHGIPFKGFTPDHFRVQHRYDEVWVSSPLLKEIYQSKFGFRPDIVYDRGYARADKLFARLPADPAFREQVAIPAGHRIVLYAPTWQQDDKGRELFPFGENQHAFLQRLSRVCRDHSAILVIRSHLNARISDHTIDNVRYCSMKDYPDTEGLLMQTDILICDWSSIAFDFLALDRPTLFLDVTPPFHHGFSLGPEFRFGCVVGDMTALEQRLGNCLAEPERYQREFVERHRDITSRVYGGNTDGRVADSQLAHLCALLSC